MTGATAPGAAVLTKAELAAALHVSPRQIDRLNLPTVYAGSRSPRYVLADVLDALKRRGTP